MMEEKATIASPERRDFFKKAGLGVGLVGIAVAGATRVEAAELAAPKGSGYRETDHVKRFYATARF